MINKAFHLDAEYSSEMKPTNRDYLRSARFFSVESKLLNQQIQKEKNEVFLMISNDRGSDIEKFQLKRWKTQKALFDRKIWLLRYLGAAEKLMFIKLKIRQIQLAKQIYSLQAILEPEMPLPRELRQNQYP